MERGAYNGNHQQAPPPGLRDRGTHGIYREAARHHPFDRGTVQDLCGADHRHRTQPPHPGRPDRPEHPHSPRRGRGNGWEGYVQPVAKTAQTAQEDSADRSAAQG